MKNQKSQRRLKISRKGGTASQLIWMVLLASELASGRQVSRLEGIKLYGGGQKELNKEIGEFDGSLAQDYSHDGERGSKLSFDFKLLQNQDRVLKRSFRIKIEVVLDPKNLKDGLYADKFTQSNQKRFFVQIFQNNQNYRGGVKPKSLIKNIEIKKIDFEANLTQNGKQINKVNLSKISLEIEFEKNVDKIGSGMRLEFSRSDKNSKEVYSGFWSWLLPLLFLYTVVYLVTSLGSDLLLRRITKAPIYRYLGYASEVPFMYEKFQIFNKLQFISLASIAFLYVSSWSILFMLFLILMEVFAQVLIWVIPLFLVEKFTNSFFRVEETYYGPLTTAIVYDPKKLPNSFEKLSRKAVKDIVAIAASSILIILAIIYPSILVYGHWILAVGAICSSASSKYKNPCFRDYFSWIAFFGFYITFEFLHINCYLAIALKSSFLGEFFGGWTGLITLQWKSLLGSQILMALGIFIDFFLIKSNILSLFSPDQEKPSHSLAAKRARHHPGVLYFEKKKRAVLVNPSDVGCYSKNSSNRSKFQLLNKKGLQPGLSPRIEWGFGLQDTHIYDYRLVDRVVYQGKEKEDLIAVYRKFDPQQIEVKIFNLKNKRVILKKNFRNISKEIMDKRDIYNLELIQIRSNNRILCFFGYPVS